MLLQKKKKLLKRSSETGSTNRGRIEIAVKRRIRDNLAKSENCYGATKLV